MSTAPPGPRPLDGIRILSLEQMQALPYGTQLLARLGAEVVKIEAPGTGDLGRGSLPSMDDPQGRRVGATFLRNNFNKESICLDLKNPEARELVLRMAPRFDVMCENLKAGSADRLGLGYDAFRSANPRIVYASVSGFGAGGDSPYDGRPAFAPVIEAMSGIYEFTRRRDQAPKVAPMGGLGDIASGMFVVIGILAALRQRDLTGEGQRVDVAMLDSVVAMTDIVMNLSSLGNEDGNVGPLIMDAFRASDGYFVLQVGREEQFGRLADIIGHPEWRDDPRLATRQGWVDHLEDVIRPDVEGWASSFTRAETCERLSAAGIAAGPARRSAEVVDDPHLRSRNMVVEMQRTDGVDRPVLVPGNPVKISGVPEVPDTRVPWLGEHTDQVLSAELGLDAAELARLRSSGAIA
jgi:formyl-CoA transferase